MASYIKKYASLEAEPVTTTPSEAAKLPDPVDKPVEPVAPVIENKVEEAAQSAIKQRLAEVERANQSASPPQQPEPEPSRVVDGDPIEEAIRDWPERAKGWVRDDPKFITDPEQSARLNYAHHFAVRETGENGTPRYYFAMESLLELPQAEPSPQPQQQQASAPSRPAGAANVSAPPSRESPSMSTGRPVVSSKVTLSAEEREVARASGLSDEQYARGKQRMLREKAAGMHDHG